jgi:hypothetical protein
MADEPKSFSPIAIFLSRHCGSSGREGRSTIPHCFISLGWVRQRGQQSLFGCNSSELWPRPLVTALAHFTQIWIQNLTTSLSQKPTGRMDSVISTRAWGRETRFLKNLPRTVSWYLAQFDLSSPLVVKLLRCPILQSQSSANPNMYSQTRPAAKTSCSASVRYGQSFQLLIHPQIWRLPETCRSDPALKINHLCRFKTPHRVRSACLDLIPKLPFFRPLVLLEWNMKHKSSCHYARAIPTSRANHTHDDDL